MIWSSRRKLTFLHAAIRWDVVFKVMVVLAFLGGYKPTIGDSFPEVSQAVLFYCGDV
jgi:hypothetical protein